MSEKEFWDEKYAKGGISGRGSIGIYRNWKWSKIKNMIGLSFTSLIDVGCGDLSFWNHPAAKRIFKQRVFKYVGLDISKEIIDRNRRKFPNYKFVHTPAHLEIEGLRSQVVFALDLLFHLMNDGEFDLTLENLCRYTNQFLVIYTWARNPFGRDKVTNGKYQYFRSLHDFMHIFNRNDMELIREFKVPYDQFGAMYFFKRVLY